ncbi:MAG: hypothetical protein ACXWKQ_04780 [Reyranella sp.]
MEAYGNNFPVPQPGLAAVYLVRGNAPPEAQAINITRSGRLAGMVTPNTWLLFDVAPGYHDFRAVGTQESNELIITTAPGETRFLMISPTTPDNAELLELSSLEGRRLVRQGQHMQELR